MTKTHKDIEWKRVVPTVSSKIGYRAVISKTFILPDGSLNHFQTYGAEKSEHVGVIALTKDHKVVIASQFRPGPEIIMDDIPGGNAEPGEDYGATALRELLEETGYTAGKMTYLGKVYKDCYHNDIWHYYLASDCTPHKDGQQLDPTEHIEVKLISIDQLLENGRKARMTDTEALYLAYDKLMKIKEES